MTMTEVRAAIASGKTTVLLFNGSTEQTGPHVVLGKHNFKARYLGERMARELGNALVAPVMPFAPTGGELLKFPGTIDLSPETFSKVNEEVTASLVKAGFKYVILLGDHGGNQEPLKTLAPRLDERYRAQAVRVFFSGDSYAKADAEIESYLKAHGFPPSNHGGVADTSELWAVSAAYVRPEKIALADPVNRGCPRRRVSPTGVEGTPRRSSPAPGKIFRTTSRSGRRGRDSSPDCGVGAPRIDDRPRLMKRRNSRRRRGRQRRRATLTQPLLRQRRCVRSSTHTRASRNDPHRRLERRDDPTSRRGPRRRTRTRMRTSTRCRSWRRCGHACRPSAPTPARDGAISSIATAISSQSSNSLRASSR
jgi:creatinine amidohydrolase/Fe(II)-dependent formamide hydrolase-like protein